MAKRTFHMASAAALAALSWSPLGCTVGASSGTPAQQPTTVAIASVSVSQTTVGDGETFDVTWNVTHSNNLGEVIDMGLYLGTAADLSSSSQRDARVFFDLATTPGSGLSDPSQSSITCSRAATLVTCGSGAGRTSRTVPAGTGNVETTFRACNQFVTDPTSEVCDTRALQMTFP